MKWILATVLLLTVGVGTGMASLVTVDFSGTNAPITNTGVLLGDVTFSYVTTAGDTASIVSSGAGPSGEGGIIAVPDASSGFAGYVSLDFVAPVSYLSFSFTVLGPSAPGDDEIVLLTSADPTLDAIGLGSVSSDTGSTGIGSMSTNLITPHGGPFSSAEILIGGFGASGAVATSFRVFDVQYDLAGTGVPEPGTYALLASGLFLLGFGRRKLLKRRS
jgi:PEP-CTERM motif